MVQFLVSTRKDDLMNMPKYPMPSFLTFFLMYKLKDLLSFAGCSMFGEIL